MDFEGVFFDTADYELTNIKLGEGSYGQVYIVTNQNDETKLSAKIINSSKILTGHDQMMLLRECLIHHKLDHPSIIKFCGMNFHSFDDFQKLEPTILTEYLPNGSLKEILDKEKENMADDSWSPTKKYICLLGIANAMKYLHKQGILHRDLKPQNILMDSNYYPRVCDFGYSRCFNQSLTDSIKLMLTSKIGTPLYMAPELFNDEENYGTAVDVYAFGMIAFEIVTGNVPYSENGNEISFKKLINNVMTGKLPTFTKGVTEKMKDLISRCLSHDPNFRPSFEDIFNELASDFSYKKVYT